MNLVHLRLEDFRSFEVAELLPAAAGTTVITGPNGTGKTTLLEAVAYLATQRSFRGSPREMLVRAGGGPAIVRADFVRDRLPVLVEAELPLEGRARIQVNRQAVRARRDLAEAVAVTVFSPDDLAIVRSGPSHRRDVLDDALRLLDRRAAADLDDLDRILRQRTALLRQAGLRARSDVDATLDVWDERLAVTGTAVASARDRLVAEIEPLVRAAYRSLAEPSSVAPAPEGDRSMTMAYRRSWEEDLGRALGRSRAEDLRRGVTSTGPHRDDLVVMLDGRDTRHQASQGEQRSLAVALRLAVHQQVTTRTGVAPILLLDDVFSELDPARAAALVRGLPEGQALLTTASPVPADMDVGAVVEVGTLRTAGRSGTVT